MNIPRRKQLLQRISSQDSRGEPYKITQALYGNHDYLQKPAHIR